MDDILEERKQKQTFLRQEIIEKGYPAQEFKQFMDNSKINGSNIDEWNLIQLQDMVQKYKDQFQQKKSVSDKLINDLLNDDWGDLQISAVVKVQKDNKQILNNFKDNQKDTQDLDLKNQQPLISFQEIYSNEIAQQDIQIDQQIDIDKKTQQSDQENIDEKLKKQKHTVVKDLSEYSCNSELNYEQNIACQKLNCTLFDQNQNIEVNLTQFSLIQGGYFSTSYLEYTLLTNPFGWQVKRRFSDFTWLRNTFIRIFPGLLINQIATIIPPLPLKKMKSSEDSEAFQRSLFLEKFINDCLKSPLLRNSRPMHEFLYITDEKVFKQRVKECNQIPKPVLLNEYYEIDGLLQLKINESLEAYCQASDEFNNQSEINYKKLKKQCKLLSQQMGQVNQSMQKISEIFSHMNKSTELFNRNVDSGQNLFIQEDYLMASLMMSEWSESFKSQKIMLEQDLHQYIKYKEKEICGFKEILKQRNFHKFEYLKIKKQLTIKKRQLIESNDFKNMELKNIELDKSKQEQLLKNKKLLFEMILPTVFILKIRKLKINKIQKKYLHIIIIKYLKNFLLFYLKKVKIIVIILLILPNLNLKKCQKYNKFSEINNTISLNFLDTLNMG